MADVVTSAPTRLLHADEILTTEALAFVAELHRRFANERATLLSRRVVRRDSIARVGRVTFRPDSAEVRDTEWTVAAPPAELLDRRVEITSAPHGAAMIAAMNAGARVWIGDLGGSTPLWSSVVAAQQNLRNAILGTISYTHPDGQVDWLRLDGPLPTIAVRPRDLLLAERHVKVDGEPATAAFVDIGLYIFHNVQRLLARGSAPYFQLQLDGYEEARLWADVLSTCEDILELSPAALKVAAVIETLPAAVEMDEILYELRDRSLGLSANLESYLFSYADCLRDEVLPPDPSGARFVRTFANQVVRVSHRRATHAIISGLDPVDAAEEGYDGVHVRHPDQVAMGIEVFDAVLGEHPNQVVRLRYDVLPDSSALTDPAGIEIVVTTDAMRQAMDVVINYVAAWLANEPLAGDAAPAELARAQIWQWAHTGGRLRDTGKPVTADLVRVLLDEREFDHEQYQFARMLVEMLCLGPDFPASIADLAYDFID